MPDHARPPVAEVFFGSVTAEVTSKALLHPLDTLKTRLQFLVLPPRARHTARGLPIISDVRLGMQIMAEATRNRHSIEPHEPLRGRREWQSLRAGVRSLYRGLSPSLIGVLPTALVYMPSYEYTKAAVQGTFLERTPFAGVVTGVASAVARVPVSVIKARLQLGQHQTTLEAVTFAAKRGNGGLFVGFRATVALDVWYAAVQFSCLEQLRALALRSSNIEQQSDPSQLGPVCNATIGFTTGMIAAILTEPLDVVRRCLNGWDARVGCAPARRVCVCTCAGMCVCVCVCVCVCMCMCMCAYMSVCV